MLHAFTLKFKAQSSKFKVTVGRTKGGSDFDLNAKSHDGGVEFLLKDSMTFLTNYFLPVAFGNVKSVNRSALFGADFGDGNVKVELGKSLRDDVKQAKPVFSFDFDDRPAFGDFV